MASKWYSDCLIQFRNCWWTVVDMVISLWHEMFLLGDRYPGRTFG
jgi:hypothetical protein